MVDVLVANINQQFKPKSQKRVLLKSKFKDKATESMAQKRTEAFNKANQRRDTLKKLMSEREHKHSPKRHSDNQHNYNNSSGDIDRPAARRSRLVVQDGSDESETENTSVQQPSRKRSIEALDFEITGKNEDFLHEDKPVDSSRSIAQFKKQCQENMKKWQQTSVSGESENDDESEDDNETFDENDSFIDCDNVNEQEHSDDDQSDNDKE